jgi:hypothetical protein
MPDGTRAGDASGADAPDEQRNGISRRALIRRAAVTGAVAWVAPQILHMSAAGAQTQTCYSFKLGGDCGCSGVNPDTGDPSCDATFNAAFAAATPPGTLGVCPPAGTIVSATGCTGAQAVVTVKQGCTITFAGGKAGEDCFVCGANCSGVGTSSVTINKPGQNNLSHVILVVCCGS